MTQLSKAEWWLLDAVAEWRTPLRFLVSQNVEELFNRKTHGLDEQQLGSVLTDLFREGLILASRTGEWEDERFVPTSVEIKQAFASAIELYYGLTQKGGQVWEALAKPDWSRYVSVSEGVNPNDAQVEALQRAFVERYVEVEYRQRYSRNFAVTGSETGEELRPWQATYWKSLPCGYRMRFRYSENPNCEYHRLNEEQKSQYSGEAALREEFLRPVWQWYTKYDPAL